MAPAAKRALDLGEQVDPELFLRPLDLIYAEHYRHRIVCNTLDALSANPQGALSKGEIKAILDYLLIDFPLHLADEELALFPILERRCRKNDNITEIVQLLRDEHEADRALVANVVGDLTRLLRDESVGDPTSHRARVLAMTETQRRHIAWENSVVLPLARKRMNAADLVDLGRAMAERRGVPYNARI